METAHTELNGMKAALLPPALEKRLLAAMCTASAEEAELQRTEAQLRRLTPAPVPLGALGRMGVAMYMAAAAKRIRGFAGKRWLHHAAAVVAVCCVAGGICAINTAVAVNAPEGQVSRSVIDTHDNQRVNWSEDGLPTRTYDVIYEDTFVLSDDENGATYTVRVPSTISVTVPEDIL